MKRLYQFTALCLSLILVITAVPVATFASDNTWNPDAGVYDITTEADLLAFRDSLNQQQYYEGVEVKLLADITMTQDYVSPDSNGDAEACFCGTFNGNNHTISNLNMISADNYTVSFLPFLGDATIKDLTLKDVTINNGYSWNAAFTPLSLGDDTIVNCHLEGDCIIQAAASFSGNWNYNAAIIADNYMGSLTVEDCTVGDGVVINGRGTTGNNKYRVAGGIVAYARASTSTTILNCVNRADISSNYIGGGIIGTVMANSESTINSALIKNCVNYGDISSNEGTAHFNLMLAGILAESSSFSTSMIDGCANYGNITVKSSSVSGSGGIVGEANSATISNSFNSGRISAVASDTLGGMRVISEPLSLIHPYM